MKKIILLLLVAMPLFAYAQTVNVHLKNGTVMKYNSSEVDYVDFSSKGETEDPVNPSVQMSIPLGTWTGNIENYFKNRWGFSSEDNYRTSMCFFEGDTKNTGTGYQADYSINSPLNDYYFSKFKWELVDGEIVISLEDRNSSDIIRSYHINENIFEGYINYNSQYTNYFKFYNDPNFEWSYYNGYVVTRSNGSRTSIAKGIFSKINN